MMCFALLCKIGIIVLIIITELENKTLNYKLQIITATIPVIVLIVISVYSIIFRKKIGYVFETILHQRNLQEEQELEEKLKTSMKPVETFSSPLMEKYAEKTTYGTYSLIDFPAIQSRSSITAIMFMTPKSTSKKRFAFENQDEKSIIKDCIICFAMMPDSFFLPCGHSGLCVECAQILLKTTECCHLCRAVIC